LIVRRRHCDRAAARVAAGTATGRAPSPFFHVHLATMTIQNVSDTARWVAMYRAMETDRPDAHFRDPFARRLAGAQGEAILSSMSRAKQMAWPMIVRTAVMDEIILDAVTRLGADLVLNLAAGLDARPWRLDLPPALRWVDVDLPGMVEHKSAVMQGEQPKCHYQAVAADLSDSAERDQVLARVTADAQRALVVSEGLLVYLQPDDVAALASALHGQAACRWWLTDLASPRLLEMMQKWWGKQTGSASFRFAPAEESGFFARFGWKELLWRGTMDDARRLKREMRGMWLWRIPMRFASPTKKEEVSRFSGVLLLERDGEG
jgi:methyltransferase (TIGR00027 family)